MQKIMFVFDIDGTLCNINKPVEYGLCQTLRRLSSKYIVVLSSGKPFGYIAGFVRQLGLDNVIVVGENGATIMYSATFPPKKYFKVPVSKEVDKLLNKIKHDFNCKFTNRIWFQPNYVNLTIFPLLKKEVKSIHAFAVKYESNLINIYYHKDSVDFTPKGFDKGTALDKIIKENSIDTNELLVFGDSENDLPMLVKSDNSYVINSTINGFKPKRYLNSYQELNSFLEKFI